VVGLALLSDTVPQDQLAQATGWVMMGMSLGLLIAPLLGGVVFDRAGYTAVFGMCYALIGLDIILRLLLVEKKVAARWGSETCARLPVTARHSSPNNMRSQCTTPISQTPDPEKATPVTLNMPNLSVEGYHQRRRDRLSPIFSLLCSRRLLAALLGALIQATLLTSFDSVLTIHAANVFGWTSTGAGLLFLPIVIPGFLSPIFGWLSDKYGGRYFVTVGFLCACPPLICLRFIDENSIKDKVLLCALLALTGLFLGLTFPSVMAEISNVVEAKEKNMLAKGHPGFGSGGAYAQAYALFNVAFAGGCMIGPLAAGFIVEDRGWATMTWVLGLLAAVAAVPSFLWHSGWLFEKK
jgi:MFS family permease